MNINIPKQSLFFFKLTLRVLPTVLQFRFLFEESSIVYISKPGAEPGTHEMCQGYQFIRVSNLDIESHMRVMAEVILHGVRNPDLGRNARTVLDRIPKLDRPPGLIRKPPNSGWGFYMDRNLSLNLVLAWLGVVFALAFMFVPVWLTVMDAKDVQTALAPLSVLASIMSVGLTAVLGIKALAIRI